MRVSGTKLMLGDKEFYVKGVNFAGGRYIKKYITDSENIEHITRWMIYGDFNEVELENELVFLKKNLGINAIRIMTPDPGDFDSLIKWHGWSPWFLPDGSINPEYGEKLTKLINLANRQGIKVQLELLHQIQAYDQVGEKGIAVGSEREKYYLNYMKSIATTLVNNPGLMSYEVINESLLNANINYWNKTSYEKRTISFIRRMVNELRKYDKNHLIATGEVMGTSEAPYNTAWHWPSPELAKIEDIDNLNGGVAYSLYDIADYIAPHAYQKPEQINKVFADVRARSQKPVVIGEMGWMGKTGLLSSNKAEILGPMENFYQAALKAADDNGLNGVMAWDPEPLFELRPGKFTERIVTYGSEFTFSDTGRKITGYSDLFSMFDYEMKPYPAGVRYKNFHPLVIVGDYDGNGEVGIMDFGVWKDKYQKGLMGLVDFGVWKREYQGR